MPTKSDLTPDSRKEQDDARNPEQKFFDREFNDIAKNYDKETADSKDDDAAVERARLKEGEEGAGEPPKKQTNVAGGEENGGGGASPWQTYTKQRDEKAKENRGMLPKDAKRNRMKVALIIILSLLGISTPLGFFGLFTFQLPALGDMITDDAGERVEKLVTKRIEKIIFRSMFDKFGNDYDKNFVITGSPLYDLYATMRERKFEAKFKDLTGYTIEKNGGTVRLVHDGKTVVTARNADQLQDLSYKDRLVGKDFKKIVRTQIPAWRFFKAKKFAKWMRIKYGIPKYGYENKDTGDPEKDGEEMHKDRLKRMYQISARNFLGMLNCLMGEANCLMTDKSSQSATKASQMASADLVNEAVDDALNQQGDPSTFKKFQEKIIDVLINKIGTKFIPIFGWIDLIASLDHFAWEHKFNGQFLLEIIREHFVIQTAAQEYGDIVGIADQVKWSQREGKEPINPYFVGRVAQQYNQMSEERAFNYVDGKPDIGTELPEEQRLNNDGKVSTLAKIGIFETKASHILGFIPHVVLTAYYETLGGGGLLGFFGGLIGKLFTGILQAITPEEFERAAVNFIVKNFTKLMAMMGRLFIDPNDPVFAFSRAYMGAQAGFDEHCKLELDCRKLSDQEANDIRTQRWDEEYIGFKSRPLHEQLFATDTHRSLVSQLSMRNPIREPDSINLGNIAKAFGSMFGYAASTVTTPANAWDFSYRNLFNSPPMGASAKDLEQPLAKEIFGTDAECPEDLEGEQERTDAFYPCKADLGAIQAMTCVVDLEDEKCKQSAPQEVVPTNVGSAEGWFWPVKTNAGLTNCYRKPPNGHTGIDLGVPSGTDVFAAKTGHIAQTGSDANAGNYIIINHGSGQWSNYQHLQTVLVKTGSVVGGQTRIGISDNTGYSTGNHLHFSITTQQGLDSRHNVSYSVDPMQFLPKDGRSCP